jgi:hypothetical protein
MIEKQEPGVGGGLPKHCSDASFLERIPGKPDTVCRVHQLTAAELNAGAAGWFYEVTGRHECGDGANGGSDRPAVRLVGSAVPGLGQVGLSLTCSFAQTEDEDDAGAGWVPPDRCGPLPAASSSHVGEACMPRVVPERGFDDRVASLQLGAGTCPGGACLVYHLGGDTSSDCEDRRDNPVPFSRRCADEADLRSRVYCTCRCDAPEGEPECACPHGFSCQPVLSDAAGDLRGGYCVKNGT